MSIPRASDRKLIPAPFAGAGLLCILLLAGVALTLFLVPGPDARARLSDILSPVIDLLAAGCLVVGARASWRRSRRLGMGWSILAAAGVLYALGDVTWAVLELGLEAPPFPSLADVFYLLYYPALLLSVRMLVARPAAAIDRWNDGLDLAVIFIAALLGFGNFLIGPIIRSNAGATNLELAILAAYPVGDLVILCAVLLILYNEPGAARAGQPDAARTEQPSLPVFLLTAGLLAMIITDCVYTDQTLQGTYASGGVLDLGWIAANLLIGLAGIAQWVGLQPGNAISEYRPGPVFLARAQWVKTYLPYLWLMGGFGLLMAAAFVPLSVGFVAISFGVSVMLLLVLVRQFNTLSENRRLNARLKEQADRLERANRELNMEIVERLRAQEKLAFDVLHDQLTGLANRRLFLDRLGQSIKRSRRHSSITFAVLFLDLDQFKIVNDSLGHSVGDQLLISLGRRLEQTLRTTDTVARFGGDEFAILVDEVEQEDTAQRVADKVLRAIAEPFRLKDRDVHVTASIGIATDVTKYEYADDLLRDVDLAMYQAKALGKARCATFQVEMRDEAFSRLRMEEDLRNALRHHEFQLYFQPITSLESDRIVAMEALLRWLHPKRGLLLPDQFLEVAESSDIILQIGEWVLQEACRQLKAWQDKQPELADLSVNVNLSNREFAQADLPVKVRRALQDADLRGNCLSLEITERVLVENYPTASNAIAALNDMGVRVEIDDFGTGYSALAYLQQFPIDAIKIDKSFINEMRRNRKGLGLVRAIVSMARELGMESVAEGIETGEQLSELKGLLCGFGQGFLVSQPLDAEQARAILRRRASPGDEPQATQPERSTAGS